MNDLLKLALLLGIGGVAIYFVLELNKSSGVGSNSDNSDLLSSDDSSVPGGGSSGGPYAGGCGYPIVCGADGMPTGQEVPLGTGVSG
jgi:hypothetical protein